MARDWPSPDIREPFGWNPKRTALPSEEDPGAEPPPELPDLSSLAGFGRSFDTPEMWGHIATMLAAGKSIRTISLECGLSRTTVWRRLRDSRALRERVKLERARIAFEADVRLHGLRREVTSAIAQAVHHGDMRTVRWLADRLGMLGPDPLSELLGPPLPESEIRLELADEDGRDAISVRINQVMHEPEKPETPPPVPPRRGDDAWAEEDGPAEGGEDA